MYCKKCGFLLNENDNFCKKCGFSVNDKFSNQNNIKQEISQNFQEVNNNINNQVDNNLQQSNLPNNGNITNNTNNSVNVNNINKVFLYSKEIAKQNGNKLPILQLILSPIIFFIISLIINTKLPDNLSFNFFMISIILFLIIFLLFFCNLDSLMKTRLTAFASTNDNKIYYTKILNKYTGSEFILAGISIDSAINLNSNNSSSILGTYSGIITKYMCMNKLSKKIQQPDIISQFIEKSNDLKTVGVYEILKVYSVEEKRHSYKIICDIKILKNNKVRLRQKLLVEKSYNQLEDLLALFNSHK